MGVSPILSTPARVEIDEGQARHHGRHEHPEIAEQTVAVLRAEIADEQPPGQLAGSQQVGDHLTHEPGRLPEGRFGRIDGDRTLGHLAVEASRRLCVASCTCRSGQTGREPLESRIDTIPQPVSSHRPEISVVIPTRNRRRLFALALASVLDQRGVRLEVIVVDEASTDDTAAMVHAIADPRVHVVRHDVPLGMTAARNRGIAAATGEWIAFLDDDDIWVPDKLVFSSKRFARRDGAGYTGAVNITADHLRRMQRENRSRSKNRSSFTGCRARAQSG